MGTCVGAASPVGMPVLFPSIIAIQLARKFCYLPAAMVRTKQTAKKSTGGVAPRITLELPTATDASAGMETQEEDVQMDGSEKFTHNNVSWHTALV